MSQSVPAMRGSPLDVEIGDPPIPVPAGRLAVNGPEVPEQPGPYGTVAHHARSVTMPAARAAPFGS